MSSAVTETTLPVVVSGDWLAERIGRPGLAVVDVRWYLDGRSGREAYLGEHLPGAVFLDLDTELSGPTDPERGRHPLPDPGDFAAALAAAGIGDATAVVAYDDTGGGSAGRLVWMLRRVGTPAALLDGGIAHWPGIRDSGEVVPAPTTRTPRPWPPELIVDTAEVAAAPSSPRLLLDARAHARYTGEQPAPVDRRPGHIPGAHNAPWQDNLRPDGRMEAAERLRERYESLGVDEAHRVVAYCGSGVSACHDLLAMEHAGLGHGRLYVGSWSAWQHDPDRPTATGTE